MILIVYTLRIYDIYYMFDVNKILIELEIKNVRIFYEEEVQLPPV